MLLPIENVLTLWGSMIKKSILRANPRPRTPSARARADDELNASYNATHASQRVAERPRFWTRLLPARKKEQASARASPCPLLVLLCTIYPRPSKA